MPLQIIPVLDVKAGIAVHAIAGRRDDYRPLRSALHPDSSPLGVARAYRDRLGLPSLYLADLDAIAGEAPALDLYRSLHSLGLSLWVDAGVRNAESIEPLMDTGISSIIVGLETIRGPKALARILASFDPRQIVLSLDLKNGEPMMADSALWPSTVPVKIAAFAARLGLQRLLLLDLAQVGTGRGIGTERLIKGLAESHPGLELIAGGGISGPEDILELERLGASAVLVGSAFHNGQLGPAELAELTTFSSALKPAER